MPKNKVSVASISTGCVAPAAIRSVIIYRASGLRLGNVRLFYS